VVGKGRDGAGHQAFSGEPGIEPVADVPVLERAVHDVGEVEAAHDLAVRLEHRVQRAARRALQHLRPQALLVPRLGVEGLRPLGFPRSEVLPVADVRAGERPAVVLGQLAQHDATGEVGPECHGATIDPALGPIRELFGPL